MTRRMQASILKLGELGVDLHQSDHSARQLFVIDSFVETLSIRGAGDALLAYATLAMLRAATNTSTFSGHAAARM